MLNGVFLINTFGDVLVQKALTISRHPWSPEMFYNQALKRSNNHILPPCVKIDKVFYTNTRRNDVYVVATTTSQTLLPYLLVASLSDFVKECGDLIGELTSQTVLNNIAVVYQLVILTFGLSHPDCITPRVISESKQMASTTSNEGRLLPFVPSNLFGVAPSKEDMYMKAGSASKMPLASKQQEKSNEIFVDLTEYLTTVIDCNGKIVHSDLKGKVSTKSYLLSPVDLQITLSDKIIEEISNSPKKEGTILISEKRFHSVVKPSEDAQRQKEFPVLKYMANPGFGAVMDYCVASDDLPLPFTMYHNFTKAQKGSLTELQLTCKLFCALPLGISPINWSANFSLPSKLQSVSCNSTLKSVEFCEDKENRILVLKSPIFPSQSHHSITIVMILSEILPFMAYEMPHLNIAFEIPNLCISNIKIQGLKVQSVTSNTTPAISKWVRCATHAKDYVFELKSDWL